MTGTLLRGEPVEGLIVQGAPGADAYVSAVRVAFAATGLDVSRTHDDENLPPESPARLIVGIKRAS